VRAAQSLLACALLGAAGLIGLATAPAATASTTLIEVEPANGATVRSAPAEVVLTFATDLDPEGASATVTPPGQPVRDAAVEVDGDRLLVDVAASAEGEYVVSYSVVAADAQGRVDGAVGFTVDSSGDQPATGGTGPWAIASLLAVVGIGAAVFVTYRTWRNARD